MEGYGQMLQEAKRQEALTSVGAPKVYSSGSSGVIQSLTFPKITTATSSHDTVQTVPRGVILPNNI